MPQMASIPQGGRPIPGQRLNTQAIEDMRQGEQRFSRFGATPSRASSPKLETFDISMDDPDIEMKETPEIMAQQIFKEFRSKLMDMYEKQSLEQLLEHYKTVLSKSDNDVKEHIIDHIEKLDYYKVLKHYEPDVYKEFIKLINFNFVEQLRRDVEILIRRLSKSTNPSKQRTRAYVQQPTLNFPIVPKMAITDKPSSPAQKRTVEQIEGIEEREENPKSKAKAKSATTKPAADDPRTLSLEEQAKAETVLNEFKRYEIEKIEKSKNIDITEDY